jgi:hypothetical protein
VALHMVLLQSDAACDREAVPTTKIREVISPLISAWSPRQPKSSTIMATEEVYPTRDEKTASPLEGGGEKVQPTPEIPAEKRGLAPNSGAEVGHI